ncbi:hypothetical protein [Salegentibacter sp.]|uniref:hypothetical protein n=1 Tax=Salegentibacter sp. TaxID=1903072 RepID=UPI0035618B2D
MKKITGFIIFLLISQFSLSQESVIQEKDISVLNQKIDSLKKVFATGNIPQFKSLPQTTGDYFDFKTSSPEVFIAALKKATPLDSLKKDFPNLQVDKELLVIKNNYQLNSGDKKLQIKSFDIKNSRGHKISLEYTDSLDRGNLKFYYSSYRPKGDSITSIRGFYLKDKFTQQEIPEKYSRWVNYTDIMVQPEEQIFYNSNTMPGYSLRDKNIDSVVDYYAKVTNKPELEKDGDWKAHRMELEQWEEKRGAYSDSLFKNDPEFKSLLSHALEYAEENKKSNGELEFFTARHISKKQALNLMRNNQQVGSCSFDNGPVNQQKRMASLAAEIPNWSVFIKSFLNVMNDNVSRVANSNIASNARSTYIEELLKLDLNLKDLLLGSSMRISDSKNEHYFSDGGKIGKAFASLDDTYKDQFEQSLEELIKDEELDSFNKLHFYNTLNNYHYFLEEGPRKERVKENIEHLGQVLPWEIRSRIENPHKELTDLLGDEKEALESFDILDSSIGSIYSYSYDGDCWMATIKDKEEENLLYDLTMPMEDGITPLSNFLAKREDLKKQIKKHPFINEIMEAETGIKLYLLFTEDRSFSKYNKRSLESIPVKLRETLNFENAISFYFSYPNRKSVRFILFENNQLLLLRLPKGYELPGYDFEALLSRTEKGFLSPTYHSYRLFDENGVMLN